MLRILRDLAAICLFFGVSGCADDEPIQESKSAPFQGVELSIAAPAGYDINTRWQIELDEWSARTGAAYTLSEYELDAANGLASNQTSAGNNPDSNAVLVLLPITDVASRRFAPISDDMLTAANLDSVDLFEGLRNGPASVGGKISLLPISSPVLTYYYRRDLFDALKLSPPVTWDAHHRLVESLAAQDLTVVAPWDEDFRATMFLARAVSYAKHPHQYSLFFDVETCEPLIDGPGFVRALEGIRRDIDTMDERANLTQLSPADCREMLLSGKAAVAITYEVPTDTEEIERPEGATIGCVRLPGNPEAYNRSTSEWESLRDEPINRCTLTAFRGLCAGVSADATEQEQRAAWELLAQVAVETNQLRRVMPTDARSLCRESQLAQPTAWIGSVFTAGESEEIVKAIADSLRDSRLVAELPVVGRKRFRHSLAQGLGRFLDGDATAQESLSQVAVKWREVTADIGKKRVLNSYRRSIGLSERR